jgi:hypothetical protein
MIFFHSIHLVLLTVSRVLALAIPVFEDESEIRYETFGETTAFNIDALTKEELALAIAYMPMLSDGLSREHRNEQLSSGGDNVSIPDYVGPHESVGAMENNRNRRGWIFALIGWVAGFVMSMVAGFHNKDKPAPPTGWIEDKPRIT